MPPRTQATEEVVDAVLTASRVLVAVAARSLAEERQGDVSLQQFRALIVLGSRGAMRPIDLSEALGIDPSTTTRLCDRLVHRRLISRRREIHDRREVRLELTSGGTQLIESVTRRRRREIARIVAEVPASDRHGLVHAFHVFGAAAGELPDNRWPRSWDL